jgi:uncharacterized membrane protein YkvA (DUF1232 family)
LRAARAIAMWKAEQRRGSEDMPTASAGAGSGGERLEREEATLRAAFWRKLGRLASRIPFAEDLLTAHYCAFDRRTPAHVRAALIAALAYFVMPLDAMPDVLPALGLTDDAAVIAAVVKLVVDHIEPAHRTAARAALMRLGSGVPS